MPTITGYWEGYNEHGINPYPLNKIPKEVNIVPIAFVAPKAGKNGEKSTTWEFGIAESVYSPEDIFGWIDDINSRKSGQKVLFSLMDTPTTHWNNVDMDAFCRSVADTVNKRGLGGVDVDAESGMPYDKYVNCFVSLIRGLRKYLDDDKIITYTCYTQSDYDTEILNRTKDDIDIVHTMAYWLDISGMKQEFDHYAEIVGKDKVSIGVEVDVTSPNEVNQMGEWLQSIGCDKMMLWSLTQDVYDVTGKKNNTWLNTISNSLEENKFFKGLMETISMVRYPW